VDPGLFGLFTLLVISILIFFATHVLSGNAAQAILGHTATPARVHQLDRQLGLDRPVLPSTGRGSRPPSAATSGPRLFGPAFAPYSASAFVEGFA